MTHKCFFQGSSLSHGSRPWVQGTTITVCLSEFSLTLPLNACCSSHKKHQSPPSCEHRSPANHHQNSMLTPNQEFVLKHFQQFNLYCSTYDSETLLFSFSWHVRSSSFESVTAISISWQLSSDNLELKMSQRWSQCSVCFVLHNTVSSSLTFDAAK